MGSGAFSKMPEIRQDENRVIGRLFVSETSATMQ